MKNKELKMGVILSYIALFVENIIPLFYTPWMLGLMGKSEYGLYNLSHSVVGYLSLLSIGLGTSIIKFLSDKIANEDREGENRLVGLFLAIYIIIGAVSLICGVVIAWKAELFFGQSLTIAEVGKLRILIILSTINTAITFPVTVFNALIIAHQKFIFNKSLGLFFTIITPCINIIILASGLRSIGLVFTATVLNIISGIIKMLYCFVQLEIRPIFKNMDFSLLKPIYKYSIFIFIAEISSMLYWSTDKILLGAFCGTAMVSVYSVGAAFNTYYCAFSTAISNVMFPKINAMVQKNADNKKLSDVFIMVGRLQFLILCLITTGFILFGKAFIVLVWGGPSYIEAYYIALITMLPSLVPLIQNVGLSIIQAKSKHQFRTICFFIIAIINIITSWIFVRDYGIMGCAIPTGVAYLLGQGITMNWYYWKKIGLDIPQFWKNIVKMVLPVLPLCVLSGFFIKIFGIQTRGVLFSSILVYVIIYIIIVWKTVMNQFEKDLFINLIKSLHIKKK